MEIRNYCYTRGDKPDYRDFAIPGNLSGADRAIIRNMVMPILNSDLERPVFVLYKTTEIVVWGVCCQNNRLSPTLYQDEKGRGVRGFFAIVISQYTTKELILPFDISYFEKIYEIDVSPYWFCPNGESHESQRSMLSFSTYHSVKASANEYIHSLNTDKFHCKRMGGQDVEQAISAALTLSNVTLAIGYDGTDRSNNTKVPLMNCVVEGLTDRTVSVKRMCPTCYRMVSHFTASGVCESCDEEVEMEDNNQNNLNCEDEMEKQEIERLQRKLCDSGFEIQEKNKTIESLKRRTIILSIICALLFLLSFWLLVKGKSDTTGNSQNLQVILSDEPENVSETNGILVKPSKINIPAEGMDSVIVTWESNCPQVRTEVNEHSWVKVLDEGDNFMILKIKRNDGMEQRYATITIECENETKTINIFQENKQ